MKIVNKPRPFSLTPPPLRPLSYRSGDLVYLQDDRLIPRVETRWGFSVVYSGSLRFCLIITGPTSLNTVGVTVALPTLEKILYRLITFYLSSENHVRSSFQIQREMEPSSQVSIFKSCTFS